MTVYNVAVQVVALVEARTADDARLAYTRWLQSQGVETLDGDAGDVFESEPLDHEPDLVAMYAGRRVTAGARR